MITVEKVEANADLLIQWLNDHNIDKPVQEDIVNELKEIREVFNEYNHDKKGGIQRIHDLYDEKCFDIIDVDEMKYELQHDRCVTVISFSAYRDDTENYEEFAFKVNADIWQSKTFRETCELGEVFTVSVGHRKSADERMNWVMFQIFPNDFAIKLKGEDNIKVNINGTDIEQKTFAYEGCHKIYLTDETQHAEAKSYNYDIYPINEIERIYVESCPLKFIQTFGTFNNIIEQGIDYKPIFIYY